MDGKRDHLSTDGNVYLVSAQVHAGPPGSVLQTSVRQLHLSHLRLRVPLQSKDVFLQLIHFILSLLNRTD